MPRTKSMGRGANGTGSIRKITTEKNGKKYTYWQARYMDENLQIDISNKELAEMSQVNEKTISNRLRVLEGNGYIESELFFDDDA